MLRRFDIKRATFSVLVMCLASLTLSLEIYGDLSLLENKEAFHHTLNRFTEIGGDKQAGKQHLPRCVKERWYCWETMTKRLDVHGSMFDPERFDLLFSSVLGS